MRVTVIELDLPYCTRTYGVAPCAAVLGVTGDIKCFNSLRTCQDRANYSTTVKTLRFCLPTEDCDYTLAGVPVVMIPALAGLSMTPAVVNPGVDIGLRETLKVTFDDFPHSDAGLDKYLSDRDYDPFKRGTFWNKLRSRWPSLEGYDLRMLRGELGADLSTYTIYHYVIDSSTGGGDSVTISAKDPIILTDKKKAQAPRLSSGILAAPLNTTDLAFTLEPAGIGDNEYPASGHIALSGKEIVSFTRTGDAITIGAREQLGTEVDEHDEGATAQLVLSYNSATVSQIFSDLLITYVQGFDPSWIDLPAWEEDVDEYIARFYNADIAKPTDVSKLLNELIEQVGLVMAWDPISQRLSLQPLRPVTSSAILHNTDSIVDSSFRVTEQPQLRVSEVWTYYGQRNPLEDLNDIKNFKVGVVTIDPDASTDYPQPAIKQIFSRWIAPTNRPAALQVNASVLARYRDAPRKFSYTARDTLPPLLGSGARLSHWFLQDETGAEAPVPVQFTSVNMSKEYEMTITAQESVFVEQPDEGGGTGGGGTGVRYVYIDSPMFNIVLRDLYDEIYPAPESGDEVRFIVNDLVGSIRNSGLPAVNVGTWPDGVVLQMVVNVAVRGHGGDGQPNIIASGVPATVGGDGLYTRFPITVINNADISGGGGGSGRTVLLEPEIGKTIRYGGAGGLGNQAGLDGANYDASVCPGPTPLGEDGPNTSSGGIGAAGGVAIDGISYVTLSGAGAVNGAQVN